MSGLKAPEGNTRNLQEGQLENGSYAARVVRVVDWGVQPADPNDQYQKGPKHQINVTFELPEEFMQDEEGNDVEDKPRWVGRRIPLNPMSSDLATSTIWSKAIDVKGEHNGDWSQYLGMPAEVVLKQNGKYTNISGVNPMRPSKAAKLAELKNEAFFFDLQNPDMDNFRKLSTWEQHMICQNIHFRGSKLYELLDGEAVVWEKGQKNAPKEKGEAPKEEKVQKEAEAPEINEDDVPW